MPINRDLWLHYFFRKDIPNWICPKCNHGILRPIENSFTVNEDGITAIKSKRYPDFPDEYKSFRFTISLRCNNTKCEELVTACGSGYGDIDYDEESEEATYEEKFIPEYFYPALSLFTIPKGCSEKISSPIRSSFKLFFADPPASANYVRKTIEAILTDRGIKRYSLSKGRRKRINLHDRILDFEKTKPEVAKKLLAIKWLGNEGSHTDSITRNDVLDAYEILELVFDDLYTGYRKSVDKKISRIIKTKKALHPST